MGIIATTTPGTKMSMPVPRVTVNSEMITDLAKIDIQYYSPHGSPSTLSFNNLKDMRGFVNPNLKLDMIGHQNHYDLVHLVGLV